MIDNRPSLLVPPQESMDKDTIGLMKDRYTSALYAYFRITNPKSSYTKFIQDNDSQPVFHYSKTITENVIAARLKKLRNSLQQNRDYEYTKLFLERRITETELLQTFWHLRSTSDITNKIVDDYIKRQTTIYGSLDRSLFEGILTHYEELAKTQSDEVSSLMDDIKRLVQYNSVTLYKPKQKTFLHYRKMFNIVMPDLWQQLQNLTPDLLDSQDSLIHQFKMALQAIGADKEGWEVQSIKHGLNILVSKYRKRVLIGRHWKPGSLLRLKQVLAHEVGCHVQRTLNKSSSVITGGLHSEEGLAIVLEQLCSSRFIYKRMLRYLAICLAIGLDGRKRTFREVYEILWRMVVITGASDEESKRRAFYETVRAFRGGDPKISGYVYIKDKIYLEENLKTWKFLESKLLSAAEFRELLQGMYAKEYL